MAPYTDADKENFPLDTYKPAPITLTLNPPLTELKSNALPTRSEAHSFAFAFDVDGVLVRGHTAIPRAKAALQKLNEHSIPFILLTNGGGMTEAAHAERVGMRLGMCIEEEQFVQSHTPFKMHVDKYKGKIILVLGGSKDLIKKLAAAYGFDEDKILTTSDLTKHHPSIHPFPEMTSAHHDQWGNLVDGYKEEKKISAIFVFSSPRDWCLDLQVCLDLMLSSGGVLGTRSAKNGDESLPNCGYLQDDQPKLYFCNPDVEWATPFAVSRLAQGGFRAALEGVWAAATKGKGQLNSWTCGKPTSTTYEFGEVVLEKYRRRVYPKAANTCSLETVYMIGDNPESDIRGALRADKVSHLNWRSVLVETGVHPKGTAPAYAPTYVAEDVWEAVRRVILEETAHDIGSCPEKDM